MQVEVCVQEHFDESDDFGNSPSDRLAPVPSLISPISPDTWEVWFQSWLEALQPDFSPTHAYELSLRLTTDREIQSLNGQYRQQDKPTDVLAFASLESIGPHLEDLDDSLPLYLGDIVISIETAQKQAQTQGHSLQVELAWLAAHGLLHLLGWDHPDDDSLFRMLDQQQNLLYTVGLVSENR